MALRSHFLAEDGKMQSFDSESLILEELKNTLNSISRDSQKRISYSAVAGIAFLALAIPLFASASILSEWFKSLTEPASAASMQLNSQTIPLLTPATNLDPR